MIGMKNIYSIDKPLLMWKEDNLNLDGPMMKQPTFTWEAEDKYSKL